MRISRELWKWVRVGARVISRCVHRQGWIMDRRGDRGPEGIFEASISRGTSIGNTRLNRQRPDGHAFFLGDATRTARFLTNFDCMSVQYVTRYLNLAAHKSFAPYNAPGKSLQAWVARCGSPRGVPTAVPQVRCASNPQNLCAELGITMGHLCQTRMAIGLG